MQRVCLSHSWINLPYPPVAKMYVSFFRSCISANGERGGLHQVLGLCLHIASRVLAAVVLDSSPVPPAPLYHTLSFRGVEQNTERGTQHRAPSKRRDPDRLSICKTPAD